MILTALKFLIGPTGRWVVIILAFISWTAYQRHDAASAARDECHADQLQQTLDEITRQRDAARKALDAAESRADKTEQDMAELEAQRDQIISDLEERAADSCVVPSDAIERLRLIR